MGLLDDAIREHLDLKRRRGADPAEVERAEHEALGPVRRNPGPGDTPEADDLSTLGEAPDGGSFDPGSAPIDEAGHESYDVPGEYDWAEEPAASTPAPADLDSVAPAEAAEAENWSAAGLEPDGLEPLPAGPPVPRPDPGARVSDPPLRVPHAGEDSDDLEDLDAATAEYRIEEEPPPAAAGEEDVLEETPDFLQDTPEHDRLWFEQRPPRDFDFDG